MHGRAIPARLRAHAAHGPDQVHLRVAHEAGHGGVAVWIDVLDGQVVREVGAQAGGREALLQAGGVRMFGRQRHGGRQPLDQVAGEGESAMSALRPSPGYARKIL